MRKFIVLAALVAFLSAPAFAEVDVKANGSKVTTAVAVDFYGPAVTKVGGNALVDVTALTGPIDITGVLNVTDALNVTGATALSSTATGVGAGYVVQSKRVRSTTAQVNAGVTLLAATAGRKYKLVNVKMIAVGGAVTSTNVTHLEVRGTQGASSAVLYKVAKAQLTQSAVNQVGTASTVVLADGASFVANDVNTAITLNPLGGTDAATATNVDIIIDYIVE